MLPAGYPQVPLRAKLAVAPWALLALVVLFKLDDWGLVHLPAAPHRPVYRPPAAAAPASPAHADIPAGYLRLYRHAGAGERWPDRATGHRYPAWAVLAAVGKVETNHGRGWPPDWTARPGIRHGTENYAGAAGPMQFLAPTWAQFGQGGDRYHPADAIAAAGRKLRAGGARSDVHAALYAYNPSWGYVAQVLAIARAYQAGGGR